MNKTITIDEYICINEIAQRLAGYEYYADVDFDCIEEAVATTYEETGLSLSGENIEAYHLYICENLI